ncbi:MAG: DUF192 domain-containing protein [Candidatus Diapherotrites archaeon]|nr:DUF192 domain-containing protein [Candidatus Diapherotrites archaeon]
MKVEWATTPWQKFMGLMFRKKLGRPMALVLAVESRWMAAIHTLFMRFPIDLVFLDSERRVVDVVKNVKPWRLNIVPKKPAKYVVEMRAGAAKYKLGMKVKLE